MVKETETDKFSNGKLLSTLETELYLRLRENCREKLDSVIRSIRPAMDPFRVGSLENGKWCDNVADGEDKFAPIEMGINAIFDSSVVQDSIKRQAIKDFINQVTRLESATPPKEE